MCQRAPPRQWLPHCVAQVNVGRLKCQWKFNDEAVECTCDWLSIGGWLRSCVGEVLHMCSYECVWFFPYASTRPWLHVCRYLSVYTSALLLLQLWVQGQAGCPKHCLAIVWPFEAIQRTHKLETHQSHVYIRTYGWQLRLQKNKQSNTGKRIP